MSERTERLVSFEQAIRLADAVVTYETAAAEMIAAWSAPGVADVDHAMPWGETPGVDDAPAADRLIAFVGRDPT